MSTIGVGGVAGAATETTFGTYEATNDWLPFTSSTLTQTDTYVSPNHLLPGGAAASNAVRRDNIKVAEVYGGSLEFVPHYDHRSTTLLLKHLMHSAATTAGAGPYTHTYDIGTTVPGLSAQVIAGISESLTAKARQFSGLCCTSWTLTVEAGGFAKITSEWIGVGGSPLQSVSGTIAVVDSEEIIGAHMTTASLIPWNSLTLYLQTLAIKVDYKLARSAVIGLYTTTKPVRSDFTEITVTAKAQVRSEAVHDAYLAGDTSDFAISFDGTSPNSIDITVHNCKLRKCDLMIGTPGELMYDLEWVGQSGSSKSGMQVVVTNSISTAETP